MKIVLFTSSLFDLHCILIVILVPKQNHIQQAWLVQILLFYKIKFDQA